MKAFLLFPAMIIILVSSSAMAQSDTIVKKPGNTVVTIGGYVDFYYAYSLNTPKDKNIPFAYNYSRDDEFNINLAFLSAKYSSDRIHGAVTFQAGTYAEFNYSPEPFIAQHIYEAYGGFKIGDRCWLDGGVFSSHIGYESAISMDNMTLTRSLNAENTPYYESGLRFTANVSAKWTFAGFILNGWQNIRDQNRGKAIATQVQFKPAANIVFNSSTYLGNDKPDSAKQYRYFHDFYILWDISPRLKSGLVYDVGIEQKFPGSKSYTSSWYNYSLIMRYLLLSKLAMAARAEYYHDPTEIIVKTHTPDGFQTMGYSINLDYIPEKNFLLRLEAKYYKSQDKIYEFGNSGLTNNNTTLTGSMVIAF